jgi:hypothetical protein
LQVHPKLRLNLEHFGKGYRRFSRYPAPATDSLADAHPVQAALGCQFILTKPKRLEKFRAENFAGGIGRWTYGNRGLHCRSVVIGDFNLGGIAGAKLKANPPLVIDADAVLALAITLEFLSWCVADEAKRQEQREKSRQHILKVGTPYPKKSKLKYA